MIRLTKLLSLFLLFTLTSCFEEEVFSDVPEIEFIDVVYKDDPILQDSLFLTFSFTDGNSDLGLIQNDDFFFPYNQFLVFLDENDSLITTSNINSVTGPIYVAELVTRNIFLLTRGGDIFFDIGGDNHLVPAYNKQLFEGDISEIALECPNLYNQNGDVYGSGSTIGLNLYTITDNNELVVETLKFSDELVVIPLDSHYNIFVEFEEEIGGEFVPLDFRRVFNSSDCLAGNFNGRIPWFDPEGRSGTITYKIQSFGFSAALQNNTRIRFSVMDREGNRSNEVLSSEFFLSDITVGQ